MHPVPFLRIDGAQHLHLLRRATGCTILYLKNQEKLLRSLYIRYSVTRKFS